MSCCFGKNSGKDCPVAAAGGRDMRLLSRGERCLIYHADSGETCSLNVQEVEYFTFREGE